MVELERRGSDTRALSDASANSQPPDLQALSLSAAAPISMMGHMRWASDPGYGLGTAELGAGLLGNRIGDLLEAFDVALTALQRADPNEVRPFVSRVQQLRYQIEHTHHAGGNVAAFGPDIQQVWEDINKVLTGTLAWRILPAFDAGLCLGFAYIRCYCACPHTDVPVNCDQASSWLDELRQPPSESPAGWPPNLPYHANQPLPGFTVDDASRLAGIKADTPRPPR